MNLKRSKLTTAILLHFQWPFLVMGRSLQLQFPFHFLFDFFAVCQWLCSWRCYGRFDAAWIQRIVWIPLNWQLSSCLACNRWPLESAKQWTNKKYVQYLSKFKRKQKINYRSPKCLISHNLSLSSSTHSSDTCVSVFCGDSARFRLRNPDRIDVNSAMFK